MAASAGAFFAMLTSIALFKKPDVSFTLNGCLAGLVAICAGADLVDFYGAFAIGAVAGIFVVIGADFVDKKLKIDDPVGAFAVHGISGMVGILLVAFFDTGSGLFYGGGADALTQLGKQAAGMLVIAGWTVLTMSITFYAIKKTVGLRVSPEEELEGLDLSEHGLINAYAGLMPDNQKVTLADETATPMAAGAETAPGIPVYDYTVPAAGTLKKVVIITRREMLGALKSQMDGLGISGMTVSYVEGFGAQKGHTQIYRGVHVDSTLLPKMKAEIVVSKIPVQDVVEAAKRAIYTGAVGDGKIFIYDVENAFRIRTGQSGAEAVSPE